MRQYTEDNTTFLNEKLNVKKKHLLMTLPFRGAKIKAKTIQGKIAQMPADRVK